MIFALNNRNAKKSMATRQLIIETATDLFIEKKSSNVSFDDIADRADLARRTVFNHFESKDRLIFESTQPVLSKGIDILNRIDKKSEIRFDDVLDLCLNLWEEFDKRLYILYSISFDESDELKDLHEEYVNLFRHVFQRISDLPANMHGNAKQIYSLVYKCFVPVLHSLSGIEGFHQKFKKCMKGLINGLS